MSNDDDAVATVSLRHLFFRYRWRVSITLGLVMVEAGLGVLYPLLIGLAINDLLVERFDGLLQLGALASPRLSWVAPGGSTIRGCTPASTGTWPSNW